DRRELRATGEVDEDEAAFREAAAESGGFFVLVLTEETRDHELVRDLLVLEAVEVTATVAVEVRVRALRRDRLVDDRGQRVVAAVFRRQRQRSADEVVERHRATRD